MLEPTSLPTTTDTHVFDFAVAGSGPAGLAAAVALAEQGLKGTLIAPVGPTPNPDDPLPARTAALFPDSVGLLRSLGVWPEIEPKAGRLAAIRLVDDTGGLLRGPEVTFKAGELGLEVLAHNVPLAALVSALQHRADRHPQLTRYACAVAGARPGGDAVELSLADGTRVHTRLAVAADGKSSKLREAAGLSTRAWTYQQTAVVAAFDHSRPHHDISTEIHRRSGPCTVVPLPGRRSSLVWLETPERAAELAALDDDRFRSELERSLGGLLGAIGDISPRGAVPMAGLAATRLDGPRTALVGETAHAFPPIGAQGLNLTLRDVATLANLAGAAKRESSDPGTANMLAAYELARRPDMEARVFAVDALNRSLLAGIPAVDLARGFGLHVLGSFPRLKAMVMRLGLQPVDGLSSLVRPILRRD